MLSQDTKAESVPVEGAPSGADKLHSLGPDALGLERVADATMLSVVSVASTHVSESQTQIPNLPFDDPFLPRFFGPGSPMPPHGGREAPRTEHGLGSGP